MQQIVVAALYKFAKLPDFRELQPTVLECCVAHNIKGTLLLALEGINGTVAGSRADIDALLGYLRSDARLANLEHKESFSDEMPFRSAPRQQGQSPPLTVNVPRVINASTAAAEMNFIPSS